MTTVRPSRLVPALLLVLGLTGCITVVNASPAKPLFAPFLGLDGAMCSLASVGPDATLLPAPPPPPGEAMDLARACRGGQPPRGQLVEVETSVGKVLGHLTLAPDASGVLLAFSGMGMPADGWVNRRFAERALPLGLATFAVVRRETRPIVLDPLREAKGGLEAARRLREACGLDPRRPVAVVGISMGGMEALLAGREARAIGLEARTAVLDPVLDVGLAAGHLDASWQGVADNAMGDYFRRILQGRWGEPAGTRFADLIARLGPGAGALTDPVLDSPAAWLCGAPPERFTVVLSTGDPVLGAAQRERVTGCFPVVDAGVPGHTPLACRLDLFDELLAAASRAAPGATP